MQDELNKNEQIINDIRQRINQYVGGPSYSVQQPIKSVDELKSFVSHQSEIKVEQIIETKTKQIISSQISSNASHCLFSRKTSSSTDVQVSKCFINIVPLSLLIIEVYCRCSTFMKC